MSKKFLEPIQSYEDVPSSGPKWPICPEQNLLSRNHYYYFDVPTGPFQCAKFKTILPADPELWGSAIFGPKLVHLPPKKNFLGKLLIPFSSTYKPVSLRKILKKFQIFGPKMAHFPKWNFFSENLLMSLVSFIQAFLHVRY